MHLSIIELIGIILGSGGLALFIKQLITLKSEKRKGDAEASEEEDKVSFIRDDKFKDNYIFLEDRLKTLNQAYSELQDECIKDAREYNEKSRKAQEQILNDRKQIAEALMEINYYKGMCCSDFNCKHRIVCKPFENCCE